MPASVTHFEIYSEAPARLASFYRELFGWRVEQAPGVDYFMIQTGVSAGQGINGGLTYRPIPEPRSWVHYVAVESLEETVASIQRLGGSVLRPRTAVPKLAWYAVVADPEGNIFAVWQPDPNAFPMADPEL
jgi:predicted enzyme related to lactoylglutathione lyase